MGSRNLTPVANYNQIGSMMILPTLENCEEIEDWKPGSWLHHKSKDTNIKVTCYKYNEEIDTPSTMI